METKEQEELVIKVEEALNIIKPFLNEDGGDIELVEITDDFVAIVKFKGACIECSMNNMTFSAGVKEAILNNVPEIKGVEAVSLSC